MSFLVYMKDRKGRIYPTVWAELPRDGSGQSVRINFVETIELPDEDAKLSLTILEEKYPCQSQPSPSETGSPTPPPSSEASATTPPKAPLTEVL